MSVTLQQLLPALGGCKDGAAEGLRCRRVSGATAAAPGCPGPGPRRARLEGSSCSLLAPGQGGEEHQRRICAAELCQERCDALCVRPCAAQTPPGWCSKCPPPGTSCLLPQWEGCCSKDEECWILAWLLHALQWNGNAGVLVRRGVPQPCTGLSGAQHCVEHEETSGSWRITEMPLGAEQRSSLPCNLNCSKSLCIRPLPALLC